MFAKESNQITNLFHQPAGLSKAQKTKLSNAQLVLSDLMIKINTQQMRLEKSTNDLFTAI
jgi:hypothetical protein